MPEPTSQTDSRRSASGGGTEWSDGVELSGASADQLARMRSAARAFAHEIRNPLNGALLHVTFLQRELGKVGADDDVLDATRVIASEIQRIAALVKHFLDSSAAPARARVSLRALCLRAVQLIARDAERAGVEVGTELDSADVTVEVDLSRMDQVLLQLLQRAVEGALASGGKVVVRARRVARDALIEVKHDGTPKAALVDTLLARVDDDPPSLSLALRIMADQGGSIEVLSTPGRTEFRVKVPIEAATSQAAGALASTGR